MSAKRESCWSNWNAVSRRSRLSFQRVIQEASFRALCLNVPYLRERERQRALLLMAWGPAHTCPSPSRSSRCLYSLSTLALHRLPRAVNMQMPTLLLREGKRSANQQNEGEVGGGRRWQGEG